MLVILMFRNKKQKNINKYKSFEQWANETLQNIENMEEEQQEKNSKTTYESNSDKKAFGKFSDNKDVKEILQRSNSKNISQIDSRSHEGKASSRGSIEGKPIMGDEGDPVNSDLRRRLQEKKSKELREKRQKKEYKNDVNYKRKFVHVFQLFLHFSSYKNTLKNKESFRRAIIMSEILAPPLAKRKKI